MKTSEIKLKIELDDKNVPEQIFWTATDGPSSGLEETKAFSLTLWDHEKQDTLRIDLWGKQMTVNDMRGFIIDTIGGLSQTAMNATSDEKMAKMIDDFARELVEHAKEMVKKEGKLA